MADIILLPKDIARFWSKTKRNPENGCLEWTGGRSPYGVFSLRRRSLAAHRVAWALAHGVIPPGGYVCHHCDNPPCVETGPGHLFLGDPLANVRDKIDKGRFSNGRERKTHCLNGHPFSGVNLRIDTLGRRVCIACRQAYAREWHLAHPGKQAEYDARRKRKL